MPSGGPQPTAGPQEASWSFFGVKVGRAAPDETYNLPTCPIWSVRLSQRAAQNEREQLVQGSLKSRVSELAYFKE